MLSDEEKNEMLEDGYNPSRRKDFKACDDLKPNILLDDYIKYLDDIQKVFGEFEVSQKITICDLNKL